MSSGARPARAYPFRRFLADRAAFLAAYALGVATCAASVFLRPGDSLSAVDLAYVASTSLACLACWAAFEWRRASRFAEGLVRAAAAGPGPSAVLPPADTGERALVAAAVRELESSYVAREAVAEERRRAHADYLLGWVHEAKTPVAAARLELERATVPEALRDSLSEELDRVEASVERVLYSARAESFSRDFFVRETDLLDVARKAAARNAKAFVRRGIGFACQPGSAFALTDAKWLGFVLDQAISNSLKYADRGGRVEVRCEPAGAGKALVVRDDGIGIAPEDLPRVFDRGFTGRNGRTRAASTGMGLYLAARLCEGLGHGIEARSEEGAFTEIRILFRAHTGYYDPFDPASAAAWAPASTNVTKT